MQESNLNSRLEIECVAITPQNRKIMSESLFLCCFTILYAHCARSYLKYFCSFQHHSYQKNEISINILRILYRHTLKDVYFALQLPCRILCFISKLEVDPIGSEWTDMLAGVYMRQCKKQFMDEGELYFRFRDDIFLSARKSKVDKNIGSTFKTEQHINYLDVRTEVETQSFRTKIFGELSVQPYMLLFNLAHPSYT